MSKDVSTQCQHKRILGHKRNWEALAPEAREVLNREMGYQTAIDYWDPPMQPSPKEMQSRRAS